MIKQIKQELAKFLKGLNFEAEQLQPEQIKISEKVVGGKVELVDGEGKLSDAPDGEYKVDDFEFVVKDGVIAEIKGEANPEEEAKEELADEEPKADEGKEAIEALKVETEALKAEVAAIKEIIAQLANKGDVAEFKSEVEKLNKTLEVIAKTPAEFSRIDNNPITKEKAENTVNNLIVLMKKK